MPTHPTSTHATLSYLLLPPNHENVVADGLSRADEGAPHEEGDSSEWMVSEDWEATTGLTHDLFQVSDAGSKEMLALRKRFQDIPIFLEVIEALLELDQGTSLHKQKSARHRASKYMIDEGKLWRVAGGHRMRACARVECVSPSEAVELAKEEHAKNSH